MFDLSIGKLLILAVIALVVFGPNELPKIASQAGKALRDLRKIAEGAKNDLREGLGPEFADFEIEDLNPKRFVQKHFLDDLNGGSAASANQGAAQSPLRPGRTAPFSPRVSAPRSTPTRPEPKNPETPKDLPRRQAETTPGQAAAAGAEFVRDLPQRQRRRGVGIAEHQRDSRVTAFA